ncbi:hypothetical protein D3C76_833840 [compost metagenome]
MEYSITGLSNSAATSRMMWMLSASNCFKCVSLSTMATHGNIDLMDGQRAVFELGTLAQRPILLIGPTRSKQYKNMPWRFTQIGLGQSMNKCSTAKRRAR